MLKLTPCSLSEARKLEPFGESADRKRLDTAELRLPDRVRMLRDAHLEYADGKPYRTAVAQGSSSDWPQNDAQPAPSDIDASVWRLPLVWLYPHLRFQGI